MWNRVPLLLRALLAAVAVTGTTTVVWGALIRSNLKFSPRLPWATLVMAVFLVFFWRFLQGRGWPRFAAAARRAGSAGRAAALIGVAMVVAAGGLGLAASIVLFLVAHRLIRWP